MTRTARPQPEVRELKRCPFCNRVTQRRNRKGELNPPPMYPGIPIAVVNEGTCDRCYKLNRKLYGNARRPELTAAEVEALKQSVDRYVSKRRARGIPEEGVPVESLEHGGKFLMEVG